MVKLSSRLQNAASRVRSLAATVVVGVATIAVTVAAYGVRQRAALLDAAAAVCIGVFVAHYVDHGAYLVAGIWGMVTAYGWQRRAR